MRVAMLPDYRGDNPYQQLLIDALAEEKVAVEIPPGYRRILPFRRQVGAGAYDLLHLHWPDTYLRGGSAPMRWLYARKLRWDLALTRRAGCPTVWTVHNLGRHDGGGDPIEMSFYRWLGRFANRVLVHDETLVAPAAEHLRIPSGKIVAVPHGHYADHYGPLPARAEARAALDLSADARVYLFLGMLRPYKGLDELFEVWPRFQAAHPEAVLLIAGGARTPEFAHRLEERARGLDGVRLRIGFVPDAEIPTHFAASDVAVFPFRQITTSGSLILALSYDRPIVTPRIPSTTGLLDFLGSLVYPLDAPDGLAEALEASWAAPAAGRAEGFARLREHYSWARAARITARVYRQALGREEED